MTDKRLAELTNTKKNIAERLKGAREAAKLTQASLAAHADISRSTIAHYEKGNVVPGGLELMKLAKALKVSPNYILSGSQDFFPSDAVEHSFADTEDDLNMQAYRFSICLMILDREVRESISELLMNLVKSKLSEEDYRMFLQILSELDKMMPEFKTGIENLMAGKEEEFQKIAEKLEQQNDD